MGRLQRVHATRTWLRGIAASIESEYSRWINSHNVDTNQSEDWCTVCATAEVERLNAEKPDGDYFVDGGWGTQADTPPYCCKCGKTLDDHLTRHGIQYELDHYASHHVKATPEAAFGFCQILGSGEFDERDPYLWRFFLRLERLHKRMTETATK